MRVIELVPDDVADLIEARGDLATGAEVEAVLSK